MHMRKCSIQWNRGKKDEENKRNRGDAFSSLLYHRNYLPVYPSRKRSKKEAASKEIRVGLLLYRGDDTFISTLRSCIEEMAKEYERTEGIKVTLDILGCKKQPEYPEQPGGPAAGVRMQCLMCEYRRSLCSFCCH